VQQDNCRDNFEETLMKWVDAILDYCKTTQVRSTAIIQVVENYNQFNSAGKQSYILTDLHS